MPNNAPEHPQTILFDTDQAAPQIHKNLSPRTMERWRQIGYGPKFVRVGRRVCYTPEAIQDFKRNPGRYPAGK